MRPMILKALGVALLALMLVGSGVSGAGLGPPWDEVLKGDDKANQLEGGPGHDRIGGRGGNDTLYGKDGRDLILGGPGNDVVRGGGRGDELYGGLGNDVLRGGDGRDVLTGGAGRDRLFGGDADDVIRAAGGGADFVDCGDGDRDRAFVDPSDLVTGCEKVTVRT
jgi:Ca2+-binding RTX toxin-like protein